MNLVNLDADIQMGSIVRSSEATAFIGVSRFQARDYTLCSPNHYLVGLPITPRPRGAWASYEGSRQKIAMGEVMVFPAGIIQHGSLSPWTGIRKDICCAFPKARFEQLMNGTIEWSETHLRETVNLKSPNIRTAVQRIGQEIVQPGFATSVVLDSLASLIAVDLQRYFHQERRSARAPRQVLPRRDIDRINQYIRAHITEDIALRDLAQLCCLSVRHFTRLFKLTTGLTIANYVINARFEIAQDMLSHTLVPIKSIAPRVGFSNVSNFTTAFKRLCGVTPGVFRHHST